MDMSVFTGFSEVGRIIPVSYTHLDVYKRQTLFQKGVNRMAQKVGEEAVETVIEATNGTEDGFIYEASDLVYHLIVLSVSYTHLSTLIATYPTR